jgi:Alcohol dehydrogenase GroES-like domain
MPPHAFLAGHLETEKNFVMGTELAGEIEEVGKDVKQFNVGDQVFGAAGLLDRPGMIEEGDEHRSRRFLLIHHRLFQRKFVM